MKCPRCAYERKPTDQVPDWQCPNCGVAYVKAARVAETGEAKPAPVLPTENTATARGDDLEASDDEALAVAASGQRLSIWAILGNLALRGYLQVPGASVTIAVVLGIALAVLALIGLLRMASGLGYSQGWKITCMVLAFVPLANIVALIVLSVRSTRRLRAAGWHVGLFGART